MRAAPAPRLPCSLQMEPASGVISAPGRPATGTAQASQRHLSGDSENWSTPWSTTPHLSRCPPGRHLWSRCLWRRRCRPLRTWRRCSGWRQWAGAGGGLPGNWAARRRRCGSTCGRAAGSPTESPVATPCSMASGPGSRSGFWPTAVMPQWLCGLAVCLGRVNVIALSGGIGEHNDALLAELEEAVACLIQSCREQLLIVLRPCMCFLCVMGLSPKAQCRLGRRAMCPTSAAKM